MGKAAVIVISSHVVRGTVGNRAVVLALELLGHSVWSVATVTLPWHPGHNARAGNGTRLVPDDAGFEALLADLARAPWLPEVGAVLTGYLGSAAQVGPVAALIDRVKAANPAALYLMDPVMGDAGRLYVPEAQAIAMRRTLLPRADALTPNAFELGWLTDSETGDDPAELVRQARAIDVARVIVTSAPGARAGAIANLSVAEDAVFRASTPRIALGTNGAGDLTAAVVLSALMEGADVETALQRATASVFDVLTDTLAAGADELVLERAGKALHAPVASVTMEQLRGL